ncbi:hypothetical protein BLSTO_01578 [Blastocystis sp. subtype 1]
MSETSGEEKVEVKEEEYNTPVTTRTGDKGTSSLYNGKRLPKSDIHFEALGSLDELNSQIGVAREFLCSDCAELDDYLEKIQCLLFSVCSAVATPLTTSSQYVLKKIHFDEAHVKNLEKWSALIYSQLPPQDSFYLPSGGKAACFLHMARTICRRAERVMCVLLQDEDITECVYQFVNRLSDFLYNAARYASLKENIEPKKWVPV